MAGRSSLNAKSLEALGAAKLAELLITLSEGDAGAKRLLRLALAEQKGPAEIAREVRQRLATVERSGSLLDDHQRDNLLKDLERQGQAISGPIADPSLPGQLLWDLLALAQVGIGLVFHHADLAALLQLEQAMQRVGCHPAAFVHLAWASRCLCSNPAASCGAPVRG